MNLRRSVVRIAGVVAALVCAAALAAPASGQQWRHETLDGAGPNGDVFGRIADGVGEHSETVVWNNQPHVFYYGNDVRTLRHAWWSGSAWFFETLDGDGGSGGRIDADVGAFVSVVVWAGVPHVFYRDNTNGDLRHGWWTGQVWFFETLDGAGGTNGRITRSVGVTSSATVWNNQPHVFYWDGTNGDLRHAWWNGRAWFFETLDGDGTSGGRVNGDAGVASEALVWGGQPHVFYRDSTNKDLRHAWWGGQAWFFETLDGNATTNGRVTNDVAAFGSSVTVWNNQPHVFYDDDTAKDLRHAWWTGSRWAFETLDGNGTTNGRTTAQVGRWSATTVWRNQPHTWYYDATNGDLRHGWWTGAKWQFETLDGNCPNLTCPDGRISGGSVAWTSSVAVWNNQPHVFHHRRTTGFDGLLRHAWYG